MNRLGVSTYPPAPASPVIPEYTPDQLRSLLTMRTLGSRRCPDRMIRIPPSCQLYTDTVPDSIGDREDVPGTYYFWNRASKLIPFLTLRDLAYVIQILKWSDGFDDSRLNPEVLELLLHDTVDNVVFSASMIYLTNEFVDLRRMADSDRALEEIATCIPPFWPAIRMCIVFLTMLEYASGAKDYSLTAAPRAEPEVVFPGHAIALLNTHYADFSIYRPTSPAYSPNPPCYSPSPAFTPVEFTDYCSKARERT